MYRRYCIALVGLVALALVAGCGGGSDNATEQVPATTENSATPATPAVDKGIGPIDHVDVSTLTDADASQGAEIFQAKCTPCHKVEERYIGPALSGVTKRRAPEWIMNMILNPDVMVRENETAKGLLAEYLAPMTNQNLTPDEAKAVLAFFMRNDSSIEDGHEQGTEVAE